MAARLIENVRAHTVSAVLQEMIFAPLGMEHTTFAPALAMTYPLALGHRADGKIARPMESGPLFTSAQDLGRFVIAFLDNASDNALDSSKAGDEQVLPLAVIAALSKR